MRLINEEQAEHLRASGEEHSEPVAVVFKGDSKPSGHEQSTIGEMPLVQSAPELKGVPGDRYTVRLHVQGSYRRVEWRKLEIDPNAKMLADAEQSHSYYVVGSCNFWNFARMESQAGGMHVAEVELQTQGGGFHIVRDKDWDQMFYPSISKSCTDEDRAIRGPDGYGLGKSWRLDGKVGDVFRITFHRSVEADTGDIRKVQSSLVRSAAKSSASKAARNPNHRYFLVGSWSNFTKLKEMSYEDAEKAFVAEVMIGESGREAFQILLNGNWLSAVHPNTNMASCFDKDHILQGPDDAGASRHWLICGQHPAGELHPGDRVRIVMAMSSGLPHSITWRKVN